MTYLGYDIGGTKCAVIMGSTDKNNNKGIKILARREIATADFASPYDTIAALNSLGDELLGLNHDGLQGIGISCGGPLDSKRGLILSPPNLPDWDNFPIVEIVKNHFKTNTVLQNDANACALAEWKFGAARGYENIIFLTFGTGMGAGLILNGSLYCGRNDLAGEVGHIRLDKSGPLGYGKLGSFEGYCSGGGIKRLAALLATQSSLAEKSSIDPASTSAKQLASAMYKGDEFARFVFETSAKKLGEGLSILIDILDPEAIVIGSIFERNSEFFTPLVQSVISAETIDRPNSCKILPSALGDEIGDYAALSLAVN